jgi:formate--tetrahydrofolate ligase
VKNRAKQPRMSSPTPTPSPSTTRAMPALPIFDVAARAGIPEDALLPFGRDKAKLDADFLAELRHRPRGALILVSGITPTPAGEGKTTTTIGLADALARRGKRVMIALREPSLGPCFGQKGGATGGGRASLTPAEDINLHFTGDFHAIGAANNLLAAMIDNHLHWGNALGLDPRRITWRRALDLNDRALRHVVMGLGGPAHGVPREGGFDITVASEVMAALCLARDRADLRDRLGRMVVGRSREGRFVTAADIGAAGAMAALLRDAALPNLVQSLEGTPALVHGGPFANIAHGCNALAATEAALALAEIVVTEAGFGADLGGEKFLDIKCPTGGLTPAGAVIVASLRALKMHGGRALSELKEPDPEAVRRGAANLLRHAENLRLFGLPVAIALNHFPGDDEAEYEALAAELAPHGLRPIRCTHFSEGGAGALELAQAVEAMAAAGPSPAYAPLYRPELPLAEKIRTIATRIYRAGSVSFAPGVERELARYEEAGYGGLAVCIAKTPYSFSADPARRGAPAGFDFPIREVRLSAGAGFVVALAGEIMTMPGLPREPAALHIDLDAAGRITGLV